MTRRWFLRELDRASLQLRFYSDKKQVSDTANAVLGHMLSFQPMLRFPDKTEEEWALNFHGASYAFLLVSRPPDIRPAVEAYVKRAQSHIHRGITRLYVLGRYEERDFVNLVLKSLLSIRELKGVETFSLFRDYRGEDGGIGGFLSVDSVVAKLGLPSRALQITQSKWDQAATATPTLDAMQPDIVDDSEDYLSGVVKALIIQLSDYDRAWISLAELGGRLRQQVPEFTPERYGGKNLFSVLKRIPFLEFDERGAGPAKAVYVRVKQTIESEPATADVIQQHPILLIVEELIRTHATPDGWIFLGTLGGHLHRTAPDLVLREHGASSLHELLSGIPTVEMEERGNGHSKTYVRLRD